jgi:hypothetical protein
LASSDLERQLHIDFAKAAIARANAAGYISKDDALARLRAVPGRIEAQQAEALIARDAAAAEQALDDPKRFRNLDEAQRALLRGKAMLARQKAPIASRLWTVSDHPPSGRRPLVLVGACL